MQRKITLPELTQREPEDNTNIIIGNDNPAPYNDEIALKAVNELLNIENLKTISRIKPEQTINLTKLYLFADTFNVPFTKMLADHILQLQISLNGLGRSELVQLVNQRNPMIVSEKPITSKDIFR